MRAVVILSLLASLARTGFALPIETDPLVSLLNKPESVGAGAPVYIRENPMPLEKRQDGDGFVPISGRQAPDGAPVYLGEDLAPFRERDVRGKLGPLKDRQAPDGGAPVYFREDLVPIKKGRH